MKQVSDSYKIESDGREIDIEIKVADDKNLRYLLHIPPITKPTRALLEEIRHELITEVAMGSSEMLDQEVVKKLKEKFREKAAESIKEKLPNISPELTRLLIGTLLNELIGLGQIEFLLNDVNLEEVIVNSASEPIRVYHKKYGWLITNIILDSESQIQNYANIIARRVGRQITTLDPILDAHLITGDRANAVLHPIAHKGHAITIRKFARDPWTVTDFINNKTTSIEVFAILWLAYQYEMNILISGGTGSGKTNFLNVCMPFIPPTQRLLTIEDTRELQLPKNLYWCPMTTRLKNPEGKGEISMLDLLVAALRMRPDRIILGEIRKREQAEVLFEAMHTGHSVYATLHADNVQETIHRLTNPPISISPNLLGAVNLNVVMFRDRRRGIRRSYQIGEFVPAEEGDRLSVKPNLLYRWKPDTDEIIKHSESLKFTEDLNRHTGLSFSEITNDIEEKKRVLGWLVSNKIRDIDSVGKIFNEYYLDKENLLDIVKKNGKPQKIIS